MKRRVNWTKIVLFLVTIACFLNALANYQQEKQIEKLTKIIEKVDIPIERKDDFFYDVSEIPQELLESEVVYE